MKRAVLFFRPIFLGFLGFSTVWMCVATVFSGFHHDHQIRPDEFAGTQVRRKLPTFHSDFCGNFTRRDVKSDFYRNYTANENLRHAVYTRANFSTNARFHFAINSSPRNFKARRTIRRTLKKLLTNDETSCAKFASLAFYVGQSSDRNAAVWLDREFRDHPHDMV